jgi:hypothetical protein
MTSVASDTGARARDRLLDPLLQLLRGGRHSISVAGTRRYTS